MAKNPKVTNQVALLTSLDENHSVNVSENPYESLYDCIFDAIAWAMHDVKNLFICILVWIIYKLLQVIRKE